MHILMVHYVYIDPENVENDILHDGLHGTCLSFSRILSGSTKPYSRQWRKQKRRKAKERKRMQDTFVVLLVVRTVMYKQN